MKFTIEILGSPWRVNSEPATEVPQQKRPEKHLAAALRHTPYLSSPVTMVTTLLYFRFRTAIVTPFVSVSLNVTAFLALAELSDFDVSLLIKTSSFGSGPW